MRHVAISGELGSGKSVVAAALARSLDAEVVSTGAIHRRIAASRGQSALQTNLEAEEDEAIDRGIDSELQRRADAPETIVFDSRMAWHFVPNSLKVHLLVDPAVGADRMAGRLASAVETYRSVDEAVAQAAARHASEQRRFLAKYAVDIDRLRNYDLVIDTTRAPIDEIAAEIEHRLRTDTVDDTTPTLRLSPERLLPTGFPVRLLRDADLGGAHEPPTIGYCRPHLFVIDGHDAVAAALVSGADLVTARLGAEGVEDVVGGISASSYLADEVQRRHLYDWEDAFGFRFRTYP